MIVVSAHCHYQSVRMIAMGFAIAVSTVAGPRTMLAAAVPATAATSQLPIYELSVSAEEWEKLRRAPRSDDRHPAKFIAGGREYSADVRYRGAWARTWPKKALKIFFEKDNDFEGQHTLNLNS